MIDPYECTHYKHKLPMYVNIGSLHLVNPWAKLTGERATDRPAPCSSTGSSNKFAKSCEEAVQVMRLYYNSITNME